MAVSTINTHRFDPYENFKFREILDVSLFGQAEDYRQMRYCQAVV
jgi:hypothetical protein